MRYYVINREGVNGERETKQKIGMFQLSYRVHAC